MKYKLLLLDLDGTLTPELGMPPKEFTPSNRLVDSIKRAQDRVSVSLCTGRDKDIVLKVIQKLSLKGPQIIEGGAKIIDIEGRDLWTKYISRDSSEKIVEIIKNTKRDFAVICNGTESVNEIPKEPLNKVTAFLLFNLSKTDSTNLEERFSPFQDLALAFNTDLSDITVYITHKEGTKTSGVKKLREILGVSKEEVVGVGDKNNDIPLLSESGFKVAMGNASEEIKKIADWVAPSVEEDGVAAVIEKFIL
jgi:Cof subfamily protein (haloacid dehalogenase superfamily)